MVFEVTQSHTITMNGFQTSKKTKFDVEFLVLNKSENRRIYGIRKERITNVPFSDNNHLKILEDLEWHCYPIEIETDMEGNFIKMLHHKKWLKNWEQKTQLLNLEYRDEDYLKEIRNKFYEIVKDEEKIIENRFKEPYWNLLFFNPPIDQVNHPDLGTSLQWNIKSLGTIPCVGRTKLRNSDTDEVLIFFESLQKLTPEIIKEMKTKVDFPNVVWEDQKVNLQVGTTFNTAEKKLKDKKAFFEFRIEGHFSYVEETIINFKRRDEKPEIKTATQNISNVAATETNPESIPEQNS
jgi:hypothetical protein